MAQVGRLLVLLLKGLHDCKPCLFAHYFSEVLFWDYLG